MAIRNRLAVLLAERNLTVREVSQATGISRTTLSQLKAHQPKMIQFRTLDTLCQFFHITPEEFFDYDPDPSSPDWFLTKAKGR